MPNSILELSTLVETNLKVRYRQTAIGFIWVILNPIILFSVQAALFAQILKHSDSSFYFYLLSGLLPWFYLSQTAEMGCNYIRANAGLIKNLRIHPFKLVTSLAIENYINMMSASLIIFSFIYLKYDQSLLSLTVFIFASLWILVLACLITFMAAMLNVLFRDTNYILHFLFTILYFMTPTFFYIENLPSNISHLLKLNPFFWIISLFRIKELSAASIEIVIVNLLILVFAAALTSWTWKKLKNKIYLKL